jgi:hypothetical protein
VNTCTADFARLSAHLKDLRCDGNALLTLRNPLALLNWTYPVIELLMVGGAIACLVHAVRWYRRRGDASNLVLWISLISGLMLIEPMAYFPHWFGMDKVMGLTFVHGQFSVQFFYDRMPLYIVAMYPVFGYLAYALVQRTGIFKKYSAFVGAACVAFVFVCLFEVIDTVGPQWRWWVWNTDLPTSKPSLGPVPYLSLINFSVALPFGVALATLLISKIPQRGGWYLVRDVAVVSIAIWPSLLVVGLPATLAPLLGVPTETARFVLAWALIAAVAVIAGWAFMGAYRARAADPSIVPDDARGDRFPLVYAVAYLACAALLWGAALPDYLNAVHGVTASGDPSGSLAVAVVSFALSIVVLVGAHVGTGVRRRALPLPEVAEDAVSQAH